jgi:D-isomer specific 2-hydroxyacid dehydrogenase, catalytic domain
MMRTVVAASRRLRPEPRGLIEILADVATFAPAVCLAGGIPPERVGRARGLIVFGGDPVGHELLARTPRVQVIACAFRYLEHVDVQACTRRGVWVTVVPQHVCDHLEAELCAARNVIDVLNGDEPRHAVNLPRRLASLPLSAGSAAAPSARAA